jgi:hypothetical protein
MKPANKLRTNFARLTIACLLLYGSLNLYGSDAAVTVGWEKLKELNPNVPTAKQTVVTQELDGKMVSIAGFMVPLEDDAQKVSEFLLVPFAGACIHVPPPPPNQMVYVKMNANTTTRVTFNDPILVTGRLNISTVDSPYGDVSYNMINVTVKPYQE